MSRKVYPNQPGVVVDTEKVAETPVGTTPPSTDDLLSTIQDRLIKSSSIVSSAPSGLEKIINSSIKTSQLANEKSKSVIASKFNREIAAAQDDQAVRITDELEQQRGFAMNIGALRRLTDLTDKNIKDLETRKQELMLQGDIETMKEINNLQVKQFEFQFDAVKETFSNLLSMGSLLINKKNSDLAERKANEKEAAKPEKLDTQVVEIAGRKYLVNTQTGDTIKDLGIAELPKPETGSKDERTEGERTQAKINSVSSLFKPGYKIPGKGIPFIDSDGYATPEGWREALRVSGLSRKDFIEQFGYLIYNAGGTVSEKYGLTPQERKLITGTE